MKQAALHCSKAEYILCWYSPGHQTSADGSVTSVAEGDYEVLASHQALETGHLSVDAC